MPARSCDGSPRPLRRDPRDGRHDPASTVWTTASGNRRARVSAIPTNLASSPPTTRPTGIVQRSSRSWSGVIRPVLAWRRLVASATGRSQTLRPSAREVVVAEPGLSGEERIGHPPFDERRKVPLDELGELVVRARPSSTFVGVGEAGRGADEGQRPHSLRVSARCGERDPAPHRVADEVAPVTGERQHRVGHGVDGVVGGSVECGPAPCPARSGTIAAGSTRSASARIVDPSPVKP